LIQVTTPPSASLLEKRRGIQKTRGSKLAERSNSGASNSAPGDLVHSVASFSAALRHKNTHVALATRVFSFSFSKKKCTCSYIKMHMLLYIDADEDDLYASYIGRYFDPAFSCFGSKKPDYVFLNKQGRKPLQPLPLRLYII
jgi:hypothetical protein